VRKWKGWWGKVKKTTKEKVLSKIRKNKRKERAGEEQFSDGEGMGISLGGSFYVGISAVSVGYR